MQRLTAERSCVFVRVKAVYTRFLFPFLGRDSPYVAGHFGPAPLSSSVVFRGFCFVRGSFSCECVERERIK